MILDWGSPA